jgi:hypothetical protein
MNAVTGGLAALLYLLAGGLLAVRLARAGGAAVGSSKGGPLALGWGAVILHAMILAQTVFSTRRSQSRLLQRAIVHRLADQRGAAGGGDGAASRESRHHRAAVRRALTLVLGLSFATERIVADPGQWPLELHILIAILAYSLLTLAAAQATLLAIQDRRLRRRQPGGFLRGIPPLTAMESLLFQMIGAGFILLSITLFSGLLFLKDIFAQHLVHKTVLSFIAWGVFGYCYGVAGVSAGAAAPPFAGR